MIHNSPSDTTAIEHKASLWVVRIDNGKLSAKEHVEFMSWVKAKPEHKLAFERLARWQININQLPELNPSQNPSIAEKTQYQTNSHPIKAMASLKALSSIAALIGLVFIVFLMRQQPELEPALLQTYQTAMGEQKEISLPDGSTVTLNTESVININFNNALRTIELIQGEAYFEVFKDPSRPFEVTTLNKVVRAVGTAFTVHAKKHSAIEVMVTEGRVEFAQISTQHNPKTPEKLDSKTIAFIDQGQLATINAKNSINVTNITAENTQQRLAWRQSMIIFKGEPLEQVIAEIGRYSGTRFTISSPALANKRIGGYFKANDVDAFISTLSSQFNISARTDNAGIIILTER